MPSASDADTLEDAERTGIESEFELRVQGVAEEPGADEEAGEIDRPA